MKLVRPEKEPIRRPVQLDRLREQLGVQFLPGEISLEPVRPVILAPTQVVGFKAKWIREVKSTTSTVGALLEWELGFDDFPFVLLGFWAQFYNGQTGSQFGFVCEVNDGRGGTKRLVLTKPIDVSGADKTLYMGEVEIYWLSGHIIPAGGKLIAQAFMVSDGVNAAQAEVEFGIIPVYQ